AMDEPVPAGGPSKEFFAAGSSFAQGDHASHLWRSFTWSNTAPGGAVMRAERVRRKSAGCRAATMRNTITRIAKVIRILMSMKFSVGDVGLIVLRSGVHEYFESAVDHAFDVEGHRAGVHQGR